MFLLSLPMRERGLKCPYECSNQVKKPSLPMRERGLKYTVLVQALIMYTVAPHAGAWIEMQKLASKRKT